LENSENVSITWTGYIRYRVNLRKFDIKKIEETLRYSEERYFDTVTHRMIVVGSHNERLVMIPYDREGNNITPVTIHATTRQQINFRLKTGRFKYD